MAETNDEVTSAAMQIILHAGNARNYEREAAAFISDKKFMDAERLLKQANDEIIEAHKIHTRLLQTTAAGSAVDPSVLFTHAQDTLMTTESEIFIVGILYKMVKGETDAE